MFLLNFLNVKDLEQMKIILLFSFYLYDIFNFFYIFFEYTLNMYVCICFRIFICIWTKFPNCQNSIRKKLTSRKTLSDAIPHECALTCRLFSHTNFTPFLPKNLFFFFLSFLHTLTHMLEVYRNILGCFFSLIYVGYVNKTTPPRQPLLKLNGEELKS